MDGGVDDEEEAERLLKKLSEMLSCTKKNNKGVDEERNRTLRPVWCFFWSLAERCGGSLAQSVLSAGLMMQDEEHLLKEADGRIKSPEIEAH